MTKRDLVIRISEKTGLAQQQVLDIVQCTLDVISEAVATGDNVELRNSTDFPVATVSAMMSKVRWTICMTCC